MEKTKTLYSVTAVDVKRMLFLRSCGFPKDINKVLAARGIIIRRDTGPCHESAPRITITRASTEADI